jgi:hypothetical protein
MFVGRTGTMAKNHERAKAKLNEAAKYREMHQ